MASESRTTVDPPSERYPNSSEGDAARLLRVFGILAMLLFLIVAAATMFAIDTLASHRPGDIDIDRQEIDRAQQLVGERTGRIDQLSHELLELTNRLTTHRAGAGNAEPASSLAVGSNRVNPSAAAAATMDRQSGTPDLVSRVYTNLFSLSSSRSGQGLDQISKLNPQQCKEFSQLVITGLEVAHADAVIAMMAIQRSGDEAERAAVIRNVLKLLNPVDGLPRLQVANSQIENSQVAEVAIQLCSDLPENQRGDAIGEVALWFIDGEDRAMPYLNNAIVSLNESERMKLVSLLGHPNPQVRQLVSQTLPTKTLMETSVVMIAGDDYVQFVYASRWLAAQPVDERFRDPLLGALRGVLFVRDGDDMPCLDLFCKWADDRVSETLQETLAKPIRDPQVVTKLIDLGIRIGAPIMPMIQQTRGEAANQWFTRYLAGEPEVRQAYQQLLMHQPPLPCLSHWSERISREGGSDQAKDLESAVAMLSEQYPETVIASEVNEFVRQIRSRLRQNENQNANNQ